MKYIILLLIFIGCANTPNGAIDLSPKEPFVREGYELNLNLRKHMYKDDYVQLLIETRGQRVAMYCIEHFRYEIVSVIHKPDTIIYIVR